MFVARRSRQKAGKRRGSMRRECLRTKRNTRNMSHDPGPQFVSFVYFVPLPHEKEYRVSGYLDLAKRASTNFSSETSREELTSRRRRKLEEAGRRGLVVRWSEYPTWIALHDPLSGEWVEVRADDCFPSLVDEANRRRKKT